MGYKRPVLGFLDDCESPKMSELLDEVRGVITTLQYSIGTEEAYVLRIERSILFRGKRHPAEMGEAEVEASLTHPAVETSVGGDASAHGRLARRFGPEAEGVRG
jgi:hypothetical protein